MQNFAANVHATETADKRGGGVRVLSLEFEKAEGGLGVEPASDDSPEKEFDRRWALTLLDRVMARLAVDATDKGKGEQFEALKPYLTGDEPQLSYAATASALAMSDAAVKVAVHRLRKKFRDLVRDEIAQTVASPAEIEDELFTACNLRPLPL